MDVSFTPAAKEVEDRLYEDGSSTAYDELWDVLDQILVDPEEAKHARWTNYVSSRHLWGTKVRSTNLTVFWSVSDATLLVVLVVEDL